MDLRTSKTKVIVAASLLFCLGHNAALTQSTEPDSTSTPSAQQETITVDEAFRDEVALNAVETVLNPKFGKLRLNPGLDTGLGFDDNVFFIETKSARSSDTYLETSPKFRIRYGDVLEPGDIVEPNFIEFSYKYFRRDYFEYDLINAENHFLSLNSQLNFGRLKITGSDDIIIQSDLVTRGVGAGISDSDFIPQDVARSIEDRTSFHDKYRGTLDLTERTDLYLEGLHRATNFSRDSRFLDSRILKALTGYQFALSDQTFLFGEVFYGQVENDPNSPLQIKGPNAHFTGGFAGIRGDITTRIKGVIKAGYESRWFAGGQPEGFDSPVFSVGLRYEPLDRTIVFLNFDRSLLLSNQLANLGVIRDQVSLSLAQYFGPTSKWSVQVGLTYQLEDFQKTPVIFETYLVTAGLNYQVQEWLSTSLSYSHEDFKPTNAFVQSYEVNRVNLRLSIGY
jgi:hypothetical protein